MADGSGWTDERVALIKKTICPKGISDDEFALFLEQCKRSGLDPLLKEAFCVGRRQNIGNREKPNWVTKHEFQPSEAGMLARAERFPDYEGISAAEVYGEDPISIDYGAGVVEHKVNPAQRKGQLVGAWARVQRKGKVPVVVWVDFAGVVQQTPLWQKMPGTMVRKCARVAALRTAYPEAFGGLYVREEMPAEEFPDDADSVASQPAPAKARAAMPAKTATREAAEIAEAEFTHVSGERRAESQQAPRESRPAEVTNFPKGGQPLTSEQQAKAEKVAAQLGGQVVQPAQSGGVVVAFGPYRGEYIRDLSDAQLSATVDLAHEKLREQPTARWAKAMGENLAELESEVERRITATHKTTRQPGEEG